MDQTYQETARVKCYGPRSEWADSKAIDLRGLSFCWGQPIPQYDRIGIVPSWGLHGRDTYPQESCRQAKANPSLHSASVAYPACDIFLFFKNLDSIFVLGHGFSSGSAPGSLLLAPGSSVPGFGLEDGTNLIV